MTDITTVNVTVQSPAIATQIGVAGLQGRPGVAEHVNIALYSGFDKTGATDSTAAVQAAFNDVENPSSPNYGKALYLPAAPNGMFKFGQITYQYPFRLIGENWRTTIIKPASGSIPNNQPLFKFADNQNNLLQSVTPLTITGNGTTVTVTFAALTAAPTVGWTIALKGVLASGAALPHVYNSSYTITASSTTSVTFASTLTDTVTTLGAATIVPGAFATHGIQIEDLQVDLGNFNGSSGVGVFKTQTYQSNRNGKIARCFYKNVPGYALDISDFYNWNISDNRFEVCGNFNLGSGGAILARAVLWNGGGNEAATPSWVANNHFQHALYDVNVFDENSDTGSGFTGKNANWNDTLFIGNVSEQGQYGFNIGTNSQHVTFISPYFEAFGTGTDNYGNAGVGSNCRTIVGKHAAIVGGIWSTITSNATNSTTKGLALSGNLSFDDGATLSTYANMVLTSQIDKATGTITTANPTTSTTLILDGTGGGGRKYEIIAATDGTLQIYDVAAAQKQLTINQYGITSLGGSKNPQGTRGTVFTQSNVIDNTLGSLTFGQYFDIGTNLWTASISGYAYALRNGNDGTLTLYANGSKTAGDTWSSNVALLTFTTGVSVTVNATTDASSVTTGALISHGGLGIAKSTYLGSILDVVGVTTLHSTAAATSTSTGALIVGGGLGVAGAGWFGSVNATGAVNSTGVNVTGSGASIVQTTTADVMSSGSVYHRFNDVNGNAGYIGFGGTSGVMTIQNYKAGTIVLNVNGGTAQTLNSDLSTKFGGITQKTVVTGLTAAGTTQGTALALTKEISEITTCASGAGVLLPSYVGTRFLVSNQGANACLVYPTSGAQINALGSNVAFSLPVGAVIEFVQFSTTQYRTTNSTYC